MAHADIEDIVSKCNGCQKYARQAHVSAQELRMIQSLGRCGLGAQYGWTFQEI